MTLGTSLFLIFILGVLLIGLRAITRAHKWKLVLKIVLALVLIGITIGAGFYAYHLYETQPSKVIAYDGLSLGMSVVDVKVQMGAPVFETEVVDEKDGEIDLVHFYKEYEWSDKADKYVRFDRDETSEYAASIICDLNAIPSLFGIGAYDTQERIRNKLGEPTHESVRADSLAKAMSYENYGVQYVIEKGKVSDICISTSGKITYPEKVEDDEQL